MISYRKKLGLSLLFIIKAASADILDFVNKTNVRLDFSVSSNECFKEDSVDNKHIPSYSERSFDERLDYDCYITGGGAVLKYSVSYKNTPIWPSVTVGRF